MPTPLKESEYRQGICYHYKTNALDQSLTRPGAHDLGLVKVRPSAFNTEKPLKAYFPPIPWCRRPGHKHRPVVAVERRGA